MKVMDAVLNGEPPLGAKGPIEGCHQIAVSCAELRRSGRVVTAPLAEILWLHRVQAFPFATHICYLSCSPTQKGVCRKLGRRKVLMGP